MEYFRVTYKYVNPHGAGPFRGRCLMPFDRKPSKGDTIAAPFGRAAVTSVSKPKPPSGDQQ